MTVFIDANQQAAVLLIGALHGITFNQFVIGTLHTEHQAHALLITLGQRGWIKRGEATKRQAQTHGERVTYCLTPLGRAVWRRLLAERHGVKRRAA